MTAIRKGWNRLGITLSIAWLVLVLGYAAYEWRFCFAPECVFRDGYPDPSFHQHYPSEPIPLICVFKGTKLFTVATAPIVGIWVIILVVMPTVKWVREGFTD